MSCYDATPAPSVRWGSLDLNPMVGVVLPGGVSTPTLYVTMTGTPATYNEGAPGLGPAQRVFEFCVKTSPPAANTHLGSAVKGTLTNPSGAPTGVTDFWQRTFATLFVNPLQDTVSNGAGIVKVDVSADQMRSALLTAAAMGAGSTGTEFITITVGGQTYEMELKLATQ